MASAPAVIATERGFHSVTVGEKKAEMENANQHDYSGLVADLRATFNTGKTADLAWRKQQLKQLQLMISENFEEISVHFRKDHRGPKIRSFFEFGPFQSAQFAIDNLDKWAAPEVVTHKGANPLDALNGKSFIQKKPKGVALVIAPWNYPINLTLDCMVSCICAGNCVVVKPSEVSVNSCTILEKLIPKYFDPEAVRVISGGVAETTALLRERFDHIMYTGNGSVARIVMEAASKHLTPCTLELGGKSPSYVDKSAKLNVAAERIGGGKWINAGQTCIAPDYVLVHKDVAKEFTSIMKEQVKTYFGNSAASIQQNENFGRIINSRHVARVSSLIEGTQGEVVAGGEHEAADNYHAPTIVSNPSLDDAVMKEEIFGPILPIIVVDSVQDAVQKVNTICDHPLALYIFAEDQAAIDYYLDNTTSGGACVNSTMEHIMNPYLPFGGIGESGMGSYHGKHGFDELSHQRGVFVKDTFLQKGWVLPGPPYSDKLFDLAVKAQITGFFTDGQKQMMKLGGAAMAGLVAYRLSARL